VTGQRGEEGGQTRGQGVREQKTRGEVGLGGVKNTKKKKMDTNMNYTISMHRNRHLFAVTCVNEFCPNDE